MWYCDQTTRIQHKTIVCYLSWILVIIEVVVPLYFSEASNGVIMVKHNCPNTYVHPLVTAGLC